MDIRNNAKLISRGSWFIFMAALLYYLAFIVRTGFPVGDVTFFTLFDDAMIAMRYGRNLAEGHGLVWNSGEYIEGYTNFLWTLWMAAIHLTGVHESKTSLLVALSGAVILLANIHVIKKIALCFTGDPWIVLTAMTLAAFNYALIYWTLRGMEVGIITLFLDYAVLLALQLRQKYSAGRFGALLGILALMLLTRTDCLLLFMLVAAWVSYFTDRKRRPATILLFALTLVVFMGGHTLFRLWYYHDPLPNTFYLKVSGTPVTTRILRGLSVYFSWFISFFIPVLIIFVTGIALRFKKLLNPSYLLLLAPFCMMSAYSVYVGGDAWEWMPYANRYITITLPLLLLLAMIVLREACSTRRSMRLLLLLAGGFTLAWYAYLMLLMPAPGNAVSGFYPTVVWLWEHLKYPAGLVVVCMLMIFPVLYLKADHEKKTVIYAPSIKLVTLIVLILCLEGLSYAHWIQFNALHVIDDRKMVKTGLKIQSLTTPETTIAVVWGGAIPYFAHRYTVDLMGKMDRTIAKSTSRMKEFWPGHTKWNYGFSVYKYHPDLILQLFFKTPADDRQIINAGYDHIRDDLFIRGDRYDRIKLPFTHENPGKLYDLIIQQ